MCIILLLLEYCYFTVANEILGARFVPFVIYLLFELLHEYCIFVAIDPSCPHLGTFVYNNQVSSSDFWFGPCSLFTNNEGISVFLFPPLQIPLPGSLKGGMEKLYSFRLRLKKIVNAYK